MLEFNATFLVAIASFIIFMGIMNKILYRPISKVVALRKQFFLENEKKQAEIAKEIKQLADEKVEKISKSQKEAFEYLSNLTKNAQIEKDQKLRLAQQDTIKEQRKNEQEIIKEEQQAKNELSLEMNNLAKEIVERVLNKKVKPFEFGDEEIKEALK